MNRKEIQELREGRKAAFNVAPEEFHIIVGMGTCGIAAGAGDVLTTLKEEIEKQNLKNVVIKKTGCMGLCHAEPTVEVKTAGMPDILYGNVDVSTARHIIGTHIMGKKLVGGHVFDYPALDWGVTHG